jgi:hypothetical protein
VVRRLGIVPNILQPGDFSVSPSLIGIGFIRSYPMAVRKPAKASSKTSFVARMTAARKMGKGKGKSKK